MWKKRNSGFGYNLGISSIPRIVRYIPCPREFPGLGRCPQPKECLESEESNKSSTRGDTLNHIKGNTFKIFPSMEDRRKDLWKLYKVTSQRNEHFKYLPNL